MCGVFTLVSSGTNRASGESVHRSLRHRGPDSFGYHSITRNGLLYEVGHARLAVRELSAAGAQPMWSNDRRWLLSYNGELYNNAQLRSGLNVDWRGSSDTETLVELIASVGLEAALARANGMFAFTAIDLASGDVHAARDTTGIKPLYYVERADGIALCSEISGLLDHGLAGRDVDRTSLELYLRLRYVPSNRTLFRGIRRLPAGQLLSWSPRPGTLRLRAWTFAAAPAGEEPLAECIDRFGRSFEDAVIRQLVSDVPVGVLLSGGIDSALVAASLRRNGVTAPCFTVGFDDDEGGVSELDDAARTAAHLGLPHHALKLGAADLVAAGERATRHLEEPLGTASVLAMWPLCELARREVTVALAGQGADEALGGYRRHRVEALREALGPGGRGGLRAICRVLPAASRSASLGRALACLSARDWFAAYLDARGLFGADEVARLGCASSDSLELAFDGLRTRAEAATRSDCARALWVDARSQLADDLLLYGDKISMAHSLEVRVPFLDSQLLALCESLPRRLRVTPSKTKRLLRLYAARTLPQEIIRRRKRSFQIPNLFRQPRFLATAREQAELSLGSAGLGLDRGIVDDVLVAGARGGAAETRAWALHSLAQWYAGFIAVR